MTQAPLEHENASKNATVQNNDPLPSSSTSLRASVGNTSDNELSEKPVREKLKKTSIASISQHATKGQESTQEADDSRVSDEVGRTQPYQLEAISDTNLDPSRGRSLKKRSFDGLEITGSYEDMDAHKENHNDKSKDHARKRSRDIRKEETSKEVRILRSVDSTLQEENESQSTLAESTDLAAYAPRSEESSTLQDPANLQRMDVEPDTGKGDLRVTRDNSLTRIGKFSPDQEMQDSASSPRKKRSRDQFDTEADREQKQKIAATEELRAQRKSDELERTEDSRANRDTVVTREGSTLSEQKSDSMKNISGQDHEGAKEVSQAPFGSTSILPLPATNTRDASSVSDPSGKPSHTSAAAFASSGFAALASSTTSPFGTLGASSTSGSKTSPFAASTTSGTGKTEPPEETATSSTQPAGNAGFGAFAKPSSSGFSTTELSPFGAAGAAKAGIFGGSVFGTGGFGSGGKLANFAAPTGDAKIGMANGIAKPIGSPNHGGSEDDASDDEGRDLKDLNEGADETDARFQHKDVETGETDEMTVFSSRASLYIFKDGAWKEGGKGTIKLNVKSSGVDQGAKSGRFIMRAHQTFRVLLNAPVLKGMAIGDRGMEPNGKSFQFAAIDNGKVVPHLLKLGETESKALYYEVRDLQQSMSEG